MTTAIGILGAGAWGTAMAVHLARRADLAVTLWARDRAHAERLQQARTNARYLPGIALDPALRIDARLSAALAGDLIVAATPVAALPDLAREVFRRAPGVPFVWLSKGFVASTPETPLPAGVGLPHQVIAPLAAGPVGIVSGPSFAEEVARGLPTALAVAVTDTPTAERVASCLRAGNLRAYVTDDLAGVEIGGAVKNVLAIAAGASDGLGFGHNARAALVTRGLAETGRLLLALGGQRETLMGLAGLGDLVLTCTGDLSRNRRVGLALAAGQPLERVLADIGHVAEGVAAARAVRRLARHHRVEMPICEAVDRVLHEGLAPRAAVEALLRREPRGQE